MLRERLSHSVTWDHAKEVTFECEPGTLSLEKVQTLKEIGVTRVSSGWRTSTTRFWKRTAALTFFRKSVGL